jgi:hypothetical protein
MNSEDVVKEFGAGNMAYDFEVETETRYSIKPGNLSDYEWVNHVVDTYEKSGRIRVRIKNGKPRLSIKVPLFTKDTATSKTCLRLEFKPTNNEQTQSIIFIRELILMEVGAQTSEKWGAEITMNNGKKAWINRNSKGSWWIEIDNEEEFCPSKDIIVLGLEKKNG